MYVSATSTRLSRGMSTPARRAMVASPGSVVEVWCVAGARASNPRCHRPEPGLGDALGLLGCACRLALALLVARVRLADDHDAAVAADHLAVIADRLDAGIDLHVAS